MPSAANVKLDKQIPETVVPDPSANSIQQNTSPIRQAIVILEHKIRNLEKRKSKLESYRELQNSGKDLNQDQKIAVAKFDEVVQTLDFARDLCKQFLGIANSSEKEAKKQARKETALRSQQELAKLREVLLVQDALTQMGQDNVREDFLLGRNGAATLTENDLKLLDDLYPEVSPKHELGNPEAFTNHVQSAAEHLLAVVDGKPKEVVGSTYSYVKEVIGKIHESGYFDQALTDAPATYYDEATVPVPVAEETIVAPPEVPTLYQTEPQSLPPPPQQQQQQQQVPETQSYYQQQPQQQPPPPQPQRPISEVLGTGSFFFLQDSELDTPPDQSPQMIAATAGAPGAAPNTIPTQTFTNQNYVGQPMAPAGYGTPNPPPPIPMPPSCLTQGGQMEFTSPQGQMLFQQYQPEIKHKPQQQQQQPPEGLRNGGGSLDDNPSLDTRQQQTNDDDIGNGSPRGGPRPKYNPQQQRRNGGGSNHQQGGGGNGGYQPFYNNNYSNNRSRGGQGQGGRSGGGGGGQRPNHNNGGRPMHKPRQPQQQ